MARKQKALPGMEAPTIVELDDAAEAYVEARDKRMKLTEKEKVAKDALIMVMKKHNKEVYKDGTVSPPLVVHLLPGKDGVKVDRADDTANEEKDDSTEKESAA